MGKIAKIARRTFLIGSAVVAGGVAFGYYQYKKPIPNPLEDDLKEDEAAITPFVKIDQSGVTLITPRADKGQGAYSIQTYLLAEELDVDPLTVQTSVGKPSKAYYNGAVMDEGAPGLGDVLGRLMGLQITGGSSTVPDMYERLRLAGAVARETLKKAAAELHDVNIADLKTENGFVILPGGEKLSYASLAPAAARVKPAKDVELRDPKDWKHLGKKVLRTDIVAKSTGAQTYGIDLRFDGMLYASVRANPGIGGDVVSYDATAAEAMRGVKSIVPISHGVAVVADNTWRAIQAVNAIDVEWGPAPYPATSEEIWTLLGSHFDKGSKNVGRLKVGNVDKAIVEDEAFTAEYKTPFLAHAPLEPMNAVVKFGDGRCDIWTGTQIPRFVENHVAELTGLKKENIHLHVQMMGGSFGRRLEDTHVLQAVEIAMATPGVPVKMTWSREEDFAHDYPRPATVARGRGMVSSEGVEAFDLDIVGASLIASQMGRAAGAPPGPDITLTTGADDQPYGIPNYRVTGYKAEENVPISSWRSVGASQNGFYHESLLDELIHKGGLDPLEERLRLCNDPVARKVLEAVGEMSGWGGAKPSQGVGRGVAMVKSFGVPTAQIVEVVDTGAGIKIAKVWLAADVGRILDPVNLEAQLSGGAIWGLGHAMNCELTYEDFAPTQVNYYDYEAMRLYQTPEIEVKALENGDIRGAGEPGVPPSAPALANAVFALNGTRVRELPMSNQVDFI